MTQDNTLRYQTAASRKGQSLREGNAQNEPVLTSGLCLEGHPSLRRPEPEPKRGCRPTLAKELGVGSALRRLRDPWGEMPGRRKRPGPEAPESSWAPSGVPTRPLGGPRAAVQRPGPGHPRPQCGGTLNAGPGDAAVPTPPQGAGLAEHTGGRSAGSSEQTPLKVKDQTPE